MSEFFSQTFTHSRSSPRSNKIVRPKTSYSQSFRPKRSLFPTQNHILEKTQKINPEQLLIKNEDYFDDFMEKLLSCPMPEAFESTLRLMFKTNMCILWINDPKNNILFSPSAKIKSNYSNTIIGLVFKTQSIIQIKNPSQCPKGFSLDSHFCQMNTPHFFFPLGDKGVVQVIKKRKSGSFDENDMETAQFIMHKFAIYGEAILSVPKINSLALSLFQESPETLNLYETIKDHFGVESCQIWEIDTAKNTHMVYDPTSDEFVASEMSVDVSKALANKGVLNSSDGENGPFLSVVTEMGRRDIWIGIISGRELPFNIVEESQFKSLMPYFIKFIVGFGNEAQKKQFTSKLFELLNVFSYITNSIDKDELENNVVKQTLQIIDCEAIRYKIFINESDRPKKCLIAQSFESEQPLIIEDPSKLKKYNPEFDSASGKVPLSLMCCPIRDKQMNAIGYIAAFSKNGKKCFDSSDSYIISTICSFTSTMYFNINEWEKIRKESEVISRSESIPKLVDNIMSISNAKRICVYSAYPDWSLIVHVGAKSNLKTIEDIEISAIKKREDAGEVHFIPIVNDENEEIGAFGYSGEIENVERYVKLISAMFKSSLVKQDVQISDIIDPSCVSSPAAANAIDLGDSIFRHVFSIANIDLIGIYKIVFKIFSRFNLFATYSITNLALFEFLKEIAITKEAVNTLQLFSSEILQSHVENNCTKQQIMAACIACLLSDFKIESSLDESIDAVVRISQAISTLSVDQTSIFRGVGENDIKQIWLMVYELTIATDPINHFVVIEEAKMKDDENNENETDDETMDIEILKLYILCAKYAEFLRFNPNMGILKTYSTRFWKRCDLSKTSLSSVKREDIKPQNEVLTMANDALKPAFEALSLIEPSISLIQQTLLGNISELTL